MRCLAAILILFCCYSASAFEIEGIAGANSTTYDEAHDADSWGVSARLKFDFYENGQGIFSHWFCPAGSIVVCNAMVGYGSRSGSNWFFEWGAGAAYHAGFGPGAVAMLSTGTSLSTSVYVSFPLFVQAGGMTGVFWSPYIGYVF